MSYFLSCDTLLSDVCTLGDYVIEWRLSARDGEIVFVSGNAGNPDPDIDAYHPIVDEIVQGGTLYPIIRYAYLNGEKYTAYYEEGSYYSPDFITCLDPVVVETLNCSTSNLPIGAAYNYRIIRDISSGSKSRTLKFDIDETVSYFAWNFQAESVPDGVKVYYCNPTAQTEELLDFLIAGSTAYGLVQNLVPANYPTNPIAYGVTTNVRMVTNLLPYEYIAGNYLKIEIIGNIYNPEEDNTKWTVQFKCLTELVPVDYSTVGTMLTTPTISWNSPNSCAYNILYERTSPVPILTSSNFYKYFNVTSSTLKVVSASVYGNWKASVNYYGLSTSGTYQANGTITYIKSSTGITVSFTNSSDYDAFYNDIQAVLNYYKYPEFLAADPEVDLEYYSIFVIIGYQNGTQIDNPGPTFAWYIHLSGNIIYDPINKASITIEFPVPAITNQYTIVEECNDSPTYVTTLINNMNGTLNVPNNTTYTTTLKRNRFIGLTLYDPVEDKSNPSMFYKYGHIERIFVERCFNLADYGWCLSGNRWYGYEDYGRISYGDVSSHESRLATWKLERFIHFTARNCSTGYEVVAQATTTTTTTTTTTVAPTTTTTTTAIPTTTTTTTTDPYDHIYIDPSSGTNGVGTIEDPKNTFTGLSLQDDTKYHIKRDTTLVSSTVIDLSNRTNTIITDYGTGEIPKFRSTATGTCAIRFALSTSCTVENLEVYTNLSNSLRTLIQLGTGTAFDGGSYNSILNCKIHDVKQGTADGGMGIRGGGDHMTIYGCEIYNVGCDGIYVQDQPTNLTIENCYIHHDNQNYAGGSVGFNNLGGGASGDSIQLNGNYDGFIIRNNILDRSDAYTGNKYVIIINQLESQELYDAGGIIEHNTIIVRSTVLGGIFLGLTEGTIVRYNKFTSTNGVGNEGLIKLAGYRCVDIVIHNNLFYNAGRGITLGYIYIGNPEYDYEGGSVNTQIYNNTFYNMTEYCIYNDGCHDVQVKNNIFYDTPLVFDVWGTPTWSITNNSYYEVDSYGTPGAGTSYQTGNPAFYNASGLDFHLMSSSVCRNNGVDVSLTEDIDGVSIPQETYPAIGAYEYNTSYTTTTTTTTP